jgi:hypothetical protein
MRQRGRVLFVAVAALVAQCAPAGGMLDLWTDLLRDPRVQQELRGHRAVLDPRVRLLAADRDGPLVYLPVQQVLDSGAVRHLERRTRFSGAGSPPVEPRPSDSPMTIRLGYRNSLYVVEVERPSGDSVPHHFATKLESLH